MAIKAGLLNKLPLQARDLAANAPSRTIALVTRSTSPHRAEFDAIGKVIMNARQSPKG
jgi:hypothetical protein